MPKDSIDIVLPADQSEGTSNTVGKWFRSVGDAVRKDDPLLEITTDKVTVEVAAPGDGVLVEILAAEGLSVEPGAVLGRIGPAGAAGPKPEEAAAPVAPAAKAVDAASAGAAAAELSPAVRRLLAQHGLDASSIPGTGRGGRITVQDVEAFVAKAPARAPAQPAPGAASGRRVPHTTMRRTIAEHMKRSVETAPHVTAVFEADLSAVVRHRGAQPEAERPTFTAYFVRATVEAIRTVPEANSRWHEDALELFDDCNIGVAVALPSGGLIVPVLHRAQDLDLSGIAGRLRDLTARARAGRLEPREVHGGTFTISNHGVSGSLMAAPIIINQPQSAILGVGKLEPRVKVAPSGELEARPCAYVTITVDHRVLDGFQANAFLTRWVEAIERWS